MNLLRLNPIQALVVSSVLEGIIAAPLLVLIVLLGADRKVMSERVSGPLSKTFGWITAAVMTLTSVYFLV